MKEMIWLGILLYTGYDIERDPYPFFVSLACIVFYLMFRFGVEYGKQKGTHLPAKPSAH